MPSRSWGKPAITPAEPVGWALIASGSGPRLRVRGVAGLRVVDLSAFPTMVSGNTNGPMMALAWRAADLILEDASDHHMSALTQAAIDDDQRLPANSIVRRHRGSHRAGSRDRRAGRGLSRRRSRDRYLGGPGDPATARKVDGDTLFNVYSVTKAVAATALHLQADRGLIDYDAPVARYWPEYGVTARSARRSATC